MKPLAGNLPYALQDATIENMSKEWRTEFEAEVKAGNFLRGGKSLLLIGSDAEETSRLFHACLIRANFPAYRITPYEIVQRMANSYVNRDNEQRRQEFEDAECFLVDDFLFDHSDWLNEQDAYRVWWFMREAARDGIVLIIASDNEKIDAIDCYPDYMWEFVEETFEVIRVGKTEKKTAGGIKKRKTNG